LPPEPTQGPGGPGKKKADHRKMMIYAAVGGGLLLVFFLIRRSSSSSTTAATTAAPTTAADLGSGTLGGGAAGGVPIDNSGSSSGTDLTTFENSLLSQIPQAIASGIQVGQANQVPAAAVAQAADPVGEVTSLIGALSPLLVGTGSGGQQVGNPATVGAQAGGSSAGSQVVQATPHPAATAPRVNSQPASVNPRAGMTYTATTYKGKQAHLYTQAVPGGVGPGNRYIIV
jgi:hypothetical protein